MKVLLDRIPIVIALLKRYPGLVAQMCIRDRAQRL